MNLFNLIFFALTTLIVTTANAEEGIVDNATVKLMCVPAMYRDGVTQVLSLCDASAINKKNGLQLNDAGCAVPGQIVDGRKVADQVLFYAYGSAKEVQKATLPKCAMDRASWGKSFSFN